MHRVLPLFLICLTFGAVYTAWGQEIDEYVIVYYPESRTVLVDDTALGSTNVAFMIEAGTHTFRLSGPDDYSPTSQVVQIFNTAYSSPISIGFTQNAPDEYVIVHYPDSRTVLVDDTALGSTNVAFMIERGTHTFRLSDPADYSPTSQVVQVFNTTYSSPMSITFTQNSPPGDPPLDDIEDACNPQCSPIVINFENGGYRLTGANAPVSFDMLGNGHAILMGWTAAGADEAFLWLDRNHNGSVTSGAELFGNFTPLGNGHLAKNGFEALAEFDANHDGVIDDRDPIWPQLLLWRDLNHNGVCEPGENSPLGTSGVTEIDLHDHWTGKHDSWGNAFRYESLISIRDGSGHAVRKHPVYDIFFVTLSE